MPKSIELQQSAEKNTLNLQGDLVLANVTDLWNNSKVLLDQIVSPICLDLHQVVQSDSAGVALLIAWISYLRQHNKEIYLSRPPAQMQAIMQVSGLTELLQKT